MKRIELYFYRNLTRSPSSARFACSTGLTLVSTINFGLDSLCKLARGLNSQTATRHHKLACGNNSLTNSQNLYHMNSMVHLILVELSYAWEPWLQALVSTVSPVGFQVLGSTPAGSCNKKCSFVFEARTLIAELFRFLSPCKILEISRICVT